MIGPCLGADHLIVYHYGQLHSSANQPYAYAKRRKLTIWDITSPAVQEEMHRAGCRLVVPGIGNPAVDAASPLARR